MTITVEEPLIPPAVDTKCSQSLSNNILSDRVDFGHASDSAFFLCARTRTLQLSSIRLLEDFSTLGELLRVFRDAIEGHKHLYMNGLLHCDIRPENIVIYEREPASDVTDAGGYLVDLDSDRVKVGRLSNPAEEVPTAEQQAYVMTLPDEEWRVGPIVRGIECALEELKEPKISDLLNGVKLDIQKDAFLWAHSIHLRDPGLASSYLTHAIVHSLRFGNLRGNGICSLANLHWNQITKHYDFATELSDDREQDSRTPTRTGTLRFSSYEILSGESYFLGDNSRHDAIHDIESFFWVLIHLCMTHEGPGGVRRKELDSENPTFSRQLYRLVREAFDNDLRHVFESTKRRFFRSVDHFKNEVIANFHPYFEGLKGLVSEWYSLLRLAYKFNGYEYHTIHDGVLRILDNALGSRLT